jgi:hypothetical protein
MNGFLPLRTARARQSDMSGPHGRTSATEPVPRTAAGTVAAVLTQVELISAASLGRPAAACARTLRGGPGGTPIRNIP